MLDGAPPQNGSVKYGGPVLGVIAMTFVFGVAIATSVPAASLSAPGGFDAVQYAVERGADQSYDAEGLAVPEVDRDGYAVQTPTPTPTPKPVSSAGSSGASGADLGGYGGAQCAAGAAEATPATTFSWPYPNGESHVGDPFGWRAEGFHKGVDMLAPSGTPVHSIADGVVIALSAGNSGTGGLYVSIAHSVDGQPLCSMYMHSLEGSIRVGPGDHVTAGQVIAATGETGNATAFHTHFELYGADGLRFDPMPWMQAHAG